MKRFTLLFLIFTTCISGYTQSRIEIEWNGYENDSGFKTPIAIIDMNNIFLETILKCDESNQYFSFTRAYSTRGKNSYLEYALDGEIEKDDDGWRISTYLYHQQVKEKGTPCSDNISPRYFEKEVIKHARRKYDDLVRILIPSPEKKEPQPTSSIFENTKPTTIQKTGLRLYTEPQKSRFQSYGHDNYLAWGVIDAGYPWKLGSSFAGRHGNSLGIGYYLELGVDWGGKSTYDETKKINMFHYGFGLKLFPYNNAYLSIGYGTLGCYKMDASNSDDGMWNTDGWRQSKGIPVLAGYDVITGDLNMGGQMLLSVGAGVSYDSYRKEWKPMVDIKIGVAWGLD